MSGPEIVTFGCRLNAYESEVMRDHAQAGGLDNAIVFNTCAVTAEAERQARQAIRRAHRENPKAEIVVTGCAAQVNPQAFADMPEVARVVGNEEKLRAETWQAPKPAEAAAERVLVQDIMAVRETAPHLLDGYVEHTRAFVQVQTGCDHRCTFCIIPYGRGNSRSVPVNDVIAQVRRLVESGGRGRGRSGARAPPLPRGWPAVGLPLGAPRLRRAPVQAQRGRRLEQRGAAVRG